ncbi:hypothetical protein K438DRAFT_1969101 [Mycena galopus ATCC 62051]|nr:hypothetical protein K438DRAFT_1969101 [Mycena galopus ATCC 62051]
MATKRDAAAEKLAADRLAREAHLEARLKDPAAAGSDGPPARGVGVGKSISSSSLKSGGEPEPSEFASEQSAPLDTGSSSGGGTATAPPVASTAPTGTPAAPSLTPSLASLMNPTSSVMASVSQFFGHKKDPRIFVSVCADNNIFDEDLAASLQKFHPVYDPLRDDDPLLSYGAVNGLLPGKTAEETMVLRDIVMRWKFSEEKPSKHGLLVFRHQERAAYSLGSFLLERFSHLILAATQILEGLNEFLGNPPKKCFLLDPEWKFLRTMELDSSHTVILMTFATLQLRLVNTGLHIRKFLQMLSLIRPRREAMLVPPPIAPPLKDKGSPALKYPVPPSLTAAPLGPVSFMPAIGIIPQYGINSAATVKPRLFNPGASISEVRAQVEMAATAAQAARASPSQFAAAAAAAAQALNAGGPPNRHWTSYNYQAVPGQTGAAPPPFATGAPPPDPSKGLPPSNGVIPTGPSQPGGYGAPAPGGEDSDRGSGGGRGHGAPGGGGNGGGGSGGGGDGGPPTNPSNNTPWLPSDWQLNHKLNLSMVPAWDGHRKTVIDYLCSVAELTRLSPQMIVDLGAMAPLKFTDRVQTWWQTMPIDFRNSVSQDWNLLFNAISVYFLNEIWAHKRTAEWEEMRFRQKGHESEWPLDFIQRHVKHHMFLFPTSTDGPEVALRILCNAPDPSVRPSNWNQAIRLGNLHDYLNHQHRYRGNAATVEEVEDEDKLLPKSSPPSKSAHAADGQTRGRFRPREQPACLDWPEGKTIKGYAFVKRDDRVRFETPKTFRPNPNKNKQLEDVSSSSLVIPHRVQRFKGRGKLSAGSKGNRNLNPSTGDGEPTVDDDLKYADPRFKDRRIVKAHRACSMPAGMGSLDVKASHMKVHIGDPDATPTIGRLDSGADITLMSEEFFNSIPSLPKPREGLRMRLYALTGKAKVLGYT